MAAAFREQRIPPPGVTIDEYVLRAEQALDLLQARCDSELDVYSIALQSLFGSHCKWCRKRRDPLLYWDHDCDFIYEKRYQWLDRVRFSLDTARTMFVDYHPLFCKAGPPCPQTDLEKGPQLHKASMVCERSSTVLWCVLKGYEYWPQPVLEELYRQLELLNEDWPVWVLCPSRIDFIQTLCKLKTLDFLVRMGYYWWKQYDRGRRGLWHPLSGPPPAADRTPFS